MLFMKMERNNQIRKFTPVTDSCGRGEFLKNKGVISTFNSANSFVNVSTLR